MRVGLALSLSLGLSPYRTAAGTCVQATQRAEIGCREVGLPRQEREDSRVIPLGARHHKRRDATTATSRTHVAPRSASEAVVHAAPSHEQARVRPRRLHAHDNAQGSRGSGDADVEMAARPPCARRTLN